MESDRQSVKLHRGWIILAGSLLILASAFVIFRILRKKKENQTPEFEEETESELSMFSEADQKTIEFYNKVKPIAFDETFSRLITAQAMHETGVFTSSLYKTANNAFGMKEVNKRPSTDQDGLKEVNKIYSEYANDEDSIRDLFLWMNYVEFDMNVSNPEDYCAELAAHNYYTASVTSYTNAVKKHYNKLKTLLS